MLLQSEENNSTHPMCPEYEGFGDNITQLNIFRVFSMKELRSSNNKEDAKDPV